MRLPGGHLLEHPNQQLVGVGQALVDVHAGMAATASFDLHHDPVVFRSRDRVVGPAEGKVHASGATDANLPVILSVEVEQDVAAEPLLLELERAGHAGLLVDGEEELERRVGKVGRFHHGEHGGHAESVVRSERRAFCLDPVAFDDHADALGVEVEDGVVVLLVDHVHVALEDDGFAVLHAGCRWLPNEHVAHGI